MHYNGNLDASFGYNYSPAPSKHGHLCTEVTNSSMCTQIKNCRFLKSVGGEGLLYLLCTAEV
jgi:hypothetical protein